MGPNPTPPSFPSCQAEIGSLEFFGNPLRPSWRVFLPGDFGCSPTAKDCRQIVKMATGSVNANSLNLWVTREPAFSAAVKRKWRKRLEDRGIRLVLAPALEPQRSQEPYPRLGSNHFTGGK